MGRAQGVGLARTANSSHLAPRHRLQSTRESLELSYRLPDWYRDAKFGIWMHWGPQYQPGDGDWPAKYMYDQPSRNAPLVKVVIDLDLPSVW